MLPRSASVSMLYNGANAIEQIAGYLNSFEYKDVASGTTDSISVVVNDRDHKWIGPWFPVKGDKLIPTILMKNWTAEGQIIPFPCGTFGVDDFSFSGGPIKMNLEALALPSATSFKAEERTETYERATLQEIGQIIADRAGISLFFDAGDVSIEKIEQNNQNDCDFYCGLVEKYGLSLKIYNDRLVIFSEADYEAKGPKFTLTPTDFDPGWTWNTKETGTYTGVRYQYTNSDKNKTFTVKAGTEERLLTCNEPADNLTEATAIALAAVNNANKGATTMSLSMMARPGLIASDTIQIEGLGRISGKYYVEQVTHSIGGGYRMSLDLRRVEPHISSPTAISSTVSEGDKMSADKGCLRIGKLSSIDYPNGKASVTYYEDLNDSTTAAFSFLAWQHWMPKEGDQVLVAHLSNGTCAAVILGPVWHDGHRPPEGQKELYRVDPRAIIERMEEAAELGEIHPFVVGNKPVGRLNWRLTSVSEAWETIYNNGALTNAKLTVTMEEYL